MGLFDTTKEKEKKPDTSHPNVFEIIIAGCIDILIWLFKALVNALLWIGQHFFIQYFETLRNLLDVRGVEKNVVHKKLMLAFCLLVLFPGTPLFLLYEVPAVRDYLTLSRNITINILHNGHRIPFPDRSYFVQEAYSHTYDFRDQGAPGVYITYSGYHEKVAQKISRGHCQMVTRSMRFIASSQNIPVAAEGFDKEVLYYITYKAYELVGYEKAQFFFLHPSLLFASKEVLAEIPVKVEHTESWEKFEQDWSRIDEESGGNRIFEVKAHARQHAIICF